MLTLSWPWPRLRPQQALTAYSDHGNLHSQGAPPATSQLYNLMAVSYGHGYGLVSPRKNQEILQSKAPLILLRTFQPVASRKTGFPLKSFSHSLLLRLNSSLRRRICVRPLPSSLEYMGFKVLGLHDSGGSFHLSFIVTDFIRVSGEVVQHSNVV